MHLQTQITSTYRIQKVETDGEVFSKACFPFFKGVEATVKTPFRVVPFFDPAPWGGQWMKEVWCQSRILPCQTIFPYTYHILSNH